MKIVTITNNKYWKGTIVMIKSLIRTFDHYTIFPIEIWATEKIDNPNEFERIIHYKTINPELIKAFENRNEGIVQRIIPAILKLDLWLPEHENTLYIDSDILFFKNFNLSEFLSIAKTKKFYAIADYGFGINMGLFYKTKSNDITEYNKILEIAKTTNKLPLLDQSVINILYKNNIDEYTHPKGTGLDFTKRHFNDNIFDLELLAKAKMIHYVGAKKPWMEMKPEFHNKESQYKKIEKLWSQYFTNTFLAK